MVRARFKPRKSGHQLTAQFFTRSYSTSAYNEKGRKRDRDRRRKTERERDRRRKTEREREMNRER